jgi:hypothetical protein
MVRSLLVILIPLLIIAAVFTNLPSDHPVKAVDWKPVLATARRDAPFPVLAPTNLPDGWRATQVRFVEQGETDIDGQPSPRNLWELNFLTPDNTFIGLDQGDLQPQDLIDDKTRNGAADGTSTVGDQTWQRLITADGRTRSLVMERPKVTTIVSGDLPYEALEAYASTLSSTDS